MNSNTFRMPARRRAAAVAAAALTAGPVLLAAPAGATGGEDVGRAGAVVLRTGLDVSLLNRTVQVPLKAALNEVEAPAASGSGKKDALTVRLDGVDRGRPFTVLRADVATAEATADGHRARGRSRLVHAKVHVPGLPSLPLVEIQEVTSRAVCAAGERPVAESNLLGAVTVLGKRITLSAGGTTRVEVPGVGEVSLELSKTRTTSRTAAAAALELQVSLNPLKLNVAEVEGTLTLAGATCESPAPPTGRAVTPAQRPEATPAVPADEAVPADPKPRTVAEPQTVAEPAEENLAETGGSSATPYMAGGAALLLAAGAATLAVTRTRARR
ncbi:SCO1860 family LAETG-anchored protein [Streptomyces lushanensis]|uniref:SCO1860 family LAETG-anchored protein n=1 Tax=Streptomyces lushanensis TaxID=1434255 RepID=UPI000B04B066|nr:SCO1860 family LAETG-anchored protein [Streptomyces lushanensis]